jgi:hypothetical protein
MLQKRVFNIIWITKDKGKNLDPDQQPDDQVIYGGKRLAIKMK